MLSSVKNKYHTLLSDHILRNSKLMFNEPEGFLKRPYIAPGGQYGKNLWDWDSWTASIALFEIVKKQIKEKTPCQVNEPFPITQLLYLYFLKTI